MGVWINLVSALELLIHFVAGGAGVIATYVRLMLQARGMGCFGVGLGVGDTAPGGYLIGERLALPDHVRLFGGFVADVCGFGSTVLDPFVTCHHRDCGDEHKCRDRDDDDQKDGACCHGGSLTWLNGSLVDTDRVGACSAV
ncbi:hypothetical protein [Mycolicibacterium aromaticivorans]|uniref:hypothetical protein n=1 Tax=Mycolicibacterium aromaticivorans TaxID=318425 RepID=UPI0012FED3E1|nr:hypothetical protein [Mycolicibacterium aromaticivorans]